MEVCNLNTIQVILHEEINFRSLKRWAKYDLNIYT